MKKILYSVMALAIAAMTFTACEDVPEPYPTPSGGNTPEEETIGTLEEPITVAKALELINGYSDGGSSTSQAYVKGVISQVQSYNSTYKSITYYISDDGSSTNQVQCYSGKGLNGADFSSKDDLKVGTAVIVKGKLKKFVNNSGATIQEIDQSSTIVWMGDAPETPKAEPKGDGSKENPFNAAAANAAALKLASGETSSDSYYIKGKVAEIKYNYGEGKFPKTADYLISDDGTNNNTFYVYASKYLGNTDYTSGTVLAVGNEVVVYGQLQNYNGTAETATNKSYLYSLNGQTEGGDTPNPQPTGNYGTAEAPLTVAQALEKISGFEMKGTSPEEAYVKGVVVSVDNYNQQYSSLTYYISDDGTSTSQLQVYSGKGLNGADFASKNDLKPGAKVVVKGTLKKFAQGDSYVPEFDKNSVIISITDNEGGNDTPESPNTGDTNTITATMQSFGLADATDLNTQTLSDGTTLTFAAEANTNAPKYYNNGTNARVYAQNSMTIKSTGKKITKVVLTCTPKYLGNEELYGEAGGQKVTVTKADPDITFSGFSNTTLKIVNDYKEPKSGTQLRIVSITITYAE